MEKEKKFMISGVFILLITLVGAAGTYAWFTWSSTSNTNLTMSIGASSDVIFKNGNDISTNKLAPVFNYTDGEKTSFTITNKSTTSFSYRISLNITSIDNELKNKSLKYKLVSNNTIITEGDFSNIENTNKLYEGELSKGNISYIFYLYIDGNEENDLNMINKSLVGTITVSEGLAKYYMKGYDTSFNEVDHYNNECFNAAFADEGEQCLFEIGPKFLNSNIIAAQISTINVVKSDKVPTGVGNAIDISREQNGSVLLYSKISSEKSERNGFDLYDIYIATKNGKVYLTNGALLFEYMINLKSVDLANMYTDEVTDMSGMFAGCISLESIDASNFNTSNVTDMRFMFSGWGGILGVSRIKNINVSGFDTSKVTNMRSMFNNLYNLITLDISKFDTSKVTDMRNMFYGMSSLTTLDVSNFNTSKVTDMSSMFNGMSSLTTLDVSNFNTSNVTYMSYMFDGMSSLMTLDVSKFDTSKVTNMGNMFNGMSSLTTLDVSNFNTSNVTDMSSMFNGMSSLTTLDVSKLDTSKVTDMRNMFYGMSKLTTIYASNTFITSAVTNSDSMFYSSSKLVGGNGTKYNSSYTDKTYARIDTSSTPGYFTLKN